MSTAYHHDLAPADDDLATTGDGDAAVDDEQTAATSTVSAVPSGVVLAPPAHRCAPIWPQPVITDPRRPPARFWLVGAHGGAGASMLAAAWAEMAGDAEGCFPGGFGEESPFVVIVARESAHGLDRAHDLITQHLSGLGGPSLLVGLVTVAAHPGRRESAALRRRREVIGGLVADQVWRIPWVDSWIEHTAEDISAWPLEQPLPTGRRRGEVEHLLPREVIAPAYDIWDTIAAYLTDHEGRP